MNVLQKQHIIYIYQEGKKYFGLNLEWDYKQVHVKLSMVNNVPKDLLRFQNFTPSKPTHYPAKFVTSIYGAKV